MRITSEQAKKALQAISKFTRILGQDVELSSVKILHQYIEQQQKKEPQVAALLKPLNMDN